MIRVLSCLFTEHNLWLAAVAAVICVVGWVGAAFVLERARAARPAYRSLWRMLAGLAAGGGAWATHFVAMLAYDPSVAIGFDPGLTIASALIGVFGAWAAFEAYCRFKGCAATIAAGVMIGASIAALHYVGMSSVVAAARQVWALDLVAASCLFVCAFAVFGLGLLRDAQTDARKMIACATLILGVVSLHFTGMGALTLIPDGLVMAPDGELDRSGLALMVTMSVCMLLLVAAIISFADRRIAQTRLNSVERVQRFADVAFEGLLLHDGRIVHDANRRFAALMGCKPRVIAGRPLNELIEFESFLQGDAAARACSKLSCKPTRRFHAVSAARDLGSPSPGA